MANKISLVLSVLAILIAMAGLAARGVTPAQKFVYYTSVWVGDQKSGMELRYFGILPIGSCYINGATVEEMKRCVLHQS